MADSRIDITIRDEHDIDDLVNAVIKEPMRRGLTGDVQVFYVDGTIKGFRINASFRSLGKWLGFIKV